LGALWTLRALRAVRSCGALDSLNALQTLSAISPGRTLHALDTLRALGTVSASRADQGSQPLDLSPHKAVCYSDFVS
jgi:hypothetical protein